MAPKASPCIQEQWLPRLERSIQLKSMKHKSKLRLCIEIFDATHREYKVWLSAIGADRLDEITSTTPVHEDDLSDAFKATLLTCAQCRE